MLNFNKIVEALKAWEKDALDEGIHNVPSLDARLAEAFRTEANKLSLDTLASELKEREDVYAEKFGVRIPLGITAVMGPGSSGKSTWLRSVAEQVVDKDAVQLVAMGEVGSLIPYSLGAVLDTLGQYDRILLVDSWKDIWNDWHWGNTALTTGGIYTGLTATLGLLSQALFLAGKAALIILNPQTSGERESVYQMVNSQCAGMVRLSATDAGSVEYAQGRMIDEESRDVTISGGVPVKRMVMTFNGSSVQPTLDMKPASGFASIFNSPIL